MDAALFGDDAIPQILSLFSQARGLLGAPLHTKKKKNKKKNSPPIARYAQHFFPSNKNTSIDLRFASISLGSSSPSSTAAAAEAPVHHPREKIFDRHRFSEHTKALMKTLTPLERAAIGAAAGGIAGAFTYTCLHPLDTIKTKLQARGGAEAYKNSLDAALKILRTQGISGFYSGISAAMVGSTFSSAIYFGTCELAKSLLSKTLPLSVVPPLAGATGNIVSSAILVPKEVITQRMQAGAAGRSWGMLAKTLEREGVRGLYVGYSAALLRNLPSGVISFSTFEYLRAAWLRAARTDSLEPWQSVASGAVAGAIAAALTTPMDVVKTRLMTQAVRTPALTYGGVAATLRRIWVEEGWAGVTRGIGPRLLHSACFSAIGFCAFETARVEILKRHIARKRAEEEKAAVAVNVHHEEEHQGP